MKDFSRDQLSSYREIVCRDCYLLTKIPSDSLDVIFDIGANMGIFSLYSKMRHPSSIIHIYEPCKETFGVMKNNIHFLHNVVYHNEALGNGELLNFCDTGYSGCNLFYSDSEREQNQEVISSVTDPYTIPSYRLSEMFKRNNIDQNKRYFIKIDCEGGERFLLDDIEAIDIIKKSIGTAIEAHFPPTRENISAKRFFTFPEWEVYNTWIHDNFEETHDIVYHCSSGGSGSGVYVLIKK